MPLRPFILTRYVENQSFHLSAFNYFKVNNKRNIREAAFIRIELEALLLGDQTHFQSKDERTKLASELSHKSTSELFDMLESSSPAVSSTRTLVSRLLLERTGRYSVELSPQEVQVSSLSLRELFQLVSDRGGLWPWGTRRWTCTARDR